MIEQRTCKHCGEPLAPHRRIDARFCDAACRSAARHARTTLSAPKPDPERDTTLPADDRQRRASAATEGHLEGYVPPPEWAWLAAYYHDRKPSPGAK
jgi:hypothetical protein